MAGITFDGIPSSQVDSTNFSGTNFYGSVGSIVTQQLTTGTLTNATITTLSGTSFVNSLGLIRGVGVGSPTVYGMTIQAGSLTTSAGSVAFLTFGTPFVDGNWSAVFSAQGLVAPPGYISGTHATSGANFVGAASVIYNWIAIGL